MAASYVAASFNDLNSGLRTNTTVGPTSPATSGQLLLALVNVVVGIAVTPPSGWTEEGTGFAWGAASPTQTAHLYWKYAGGSEPSDYTWTHNATFSFAAVWLCQNTASVSVIDFSASGITVSGQDPNTSGTTTEANVLLWACFTYSASAGTVTTPAGYAQEGDLVNTFGVADLLQVAAGGTGTVTYDTTVDDNTVILLFGVKSAAGATKFLLVRP